MALYADRVKQSLGITGTGTVTLTLATTGTGYQSFLSAFGTGTQTVAYCIADQSGPNWEVGTGSYNGSANTLARTTVLASSNGGLLTNFSGGTQDVFCTAPAKYLDTFTSTNQGVVPASGGGTANFLRADGTFAAPPAVTPASPTTSVQFNNAGAFGGASTFTYNSGTDTLSVGKLVSANFTSAAQGLVPASGGGTTNFLRADGSFAAPPVTAPAGSNTQIQFNNAGAFGATAGFSYNTSTSTFNIAPASTNVIIEPVAPTGAQTSSSITLRTKNASATNGVGGNIFVSTGSGLGTGASGRISFTTAASSNVSGSISFVAGNGTNEGGSMTFAAGAGTGTNSSGGNIQIQTGIGKGTGSGGGIEITGGSCVGTGFGGGFAMFGGYASLGVGGDFQLAAGGGGAASGSLYIGTDSNPSCFTITEDGAAASQMGFFNAAPVTQPTAVPVTAAGIHAALVSLGLIT